MEKMILVEQRVISKLVKLVCKVNKKLDYLMEMPEYSKDWLTVKEVETHFIERGQHYPQHNLA